MFKYYYYYLSIIITQFQRNSIILLSTIFIVTQKYMMATMSIYIDVIYNVLWAVNPNNKQWILIILIVKIIQYEVVTMSTRLLFFHLSFLPHNLYNTIVWSWQANNKWPAILHAWTVWYGATVAWPGRCYDNSGTVKQ